LIIGFCLLFFLNLILILGKELSHVFLAQESLRVVLEQGGQRGKFSVVGASLQGRSGAIGTGTLSDISAITGQLCCQLGANGR